uniref:Uncharacterized protein n=1 Tax=Zosterops lateralis melanops TaxID=1220523 RepID=A0A8D2QUW1_ZOSLA
RGQDTQDTFVTVTTDSDNTSLPLLTKGISQDLHGHPLLIHFLLVASLCSHLDTAGKGSSNSAPSNCRNSAHHSSSQHHRIN